MTTIANAESGASVRAKLNATGIRLNNFAGNVAPTVNEDTADGYEVGSLWLDTVAGTLYVCSNASAGAAVWVGFATVTGLSTVANAALVIADGQTWAAGAVPVASATENEFELMTPETPGVTTLFGGGPETVVADDVEAAMAWPSALVEDVSDNFDLSDIDEWFGKIVVPDSGTYTITEAGIEAKIPNGNASIVTVHVEFPATSSATLNITGVDVDISGNGVSFVGDGANKITWLLYFQKWPDNRITLKSENPES